MNLRVLNSNCNFAQDTNGNGFSALSGSNTSVTTYQQFDLTNGQSHVSLVFYNGSFGTVNTNPVTVKATIEIRYDGHAFPKTYYQLTFGGNSTVTMQPGQIVQSDPLAVTTYPGANLYSLAYFSVPVGGIFPISNNNYASGTYVYNADVTGTQTNGQEVAGLTGSGVVNLPGPTCILGDGGPLTAGVFGDSIAIGLYDSGASGYIRRGLLAETNPPTVPVLMLAHGGETIATFVQNGCSDPRFGFASYVDRGIIEYPINDINAFTPLATIQANILAAARALVGGYSIPVYLCTMCPRTNSTDGWTTTANQSTIAGVSSVVAAYNTWARSVPSPFSGCIDAGSEVEYSGNSDLWIPNTAYDGLHPNPTGYADAAAAVPLSRFESTVPQSGEITSLPQPPGGGYGGGIYSGGFSINENSIVTGGLNIGDGQ